MTAVLGVSGAGVTAQESATPGLIAPFVTRSSSPHAADWGRSLSRALEYLSVRIATRDGMSEADALIGRTVTLRVRPIEHGAEIVVELIPLTERLLGVAAEASEEPELDLGID
jgi:hypothetical protein